MAYAATTLCGLQDSYPNSKFPNTISCYDELLVKTPSWQALGSSLPAFFKRLKLTEFRTSCRGRTADRTTGANPNNFMCWPSKNTSIAIMHGCGGLHEAQPL